MFNVVQQQLRVYIVSLQDVLPCVMATLTWVTYVEPAPDASKNINFPHLYKGLITFVYIPLQSVNKNHVFVTELCVLFHVLLPI